ncbi:hypothetical protein CISIN_1g026289mg [Citrus sinensis]|uniref:Cytidyltransferase-like domain-containing protein n=1 Tax=Citrus sinensis TaxID=2711 RepID=A0A067EVH5_CITSI|nr:hypothetical protein CISIN_1g026289mg [Citrus sinensis]
MDVPLPLEKLSLESKTQGKTYVVLVATGSFNPPTFMHLRMFELARDTLNSEGYCVIGGYMSPVNDAYKKRGLISAEHRINLCNLACKSSDFIMVDPWEANQSGYQRTLTVLSRVKNFLIEAGLISTGKKQNYIFPPCSASVELSCMSVSLCLIYLIFHKYSCIYETDKHITSY